MAIEAQDGLLGYKPCTKNLIDVHSAYALFAAAPHETVKTVTQAAKEICAAWNDVYGKAPKASMFVLFKVETVGFFKKSKMLLSGNIRRQSYYFFFFHRIPVSDSSSRKNLRSGRTRSTPSTAAERLKII